MSAFRPQMEIRRATAHSKKEAQVRLGKVRTNSNLYKMRRRAVRNFKPEKERPTVNTVESITLITIVLVLVYFGASKWKRKRKNRQQLTDRIFRTGDDDE